MTQSKVKEVSSLYGGFWDMNLRDHCYMTNPYFPPQGLIDSLGARLRELVKSYPSTNRHISSLVARSAGLDPDNVVVANGASELISTLTGRFIRNLAVPVPTFDEFVNRARGLGRDVSPFHLPEDFTLDVAGFIDHVHRSGSNAALLIQPNNPTGTVLSREEVLHVLESLRDLDLVIVDESFIDFVPRDPVPSVSDAMSSFPNLVILKSLSKTYGIPGLRLGYAASGDPDRVAMMRGDVPIWSINSLAQRFLEELPGYEDEFAASCEQVRAAIRLLYDGLTAVPYLHPYPTEGNFVLCRILAGYTAPELAERLFTECGILINDCSGKIGLDDRFVRFAGRTAEENIQLVEALRALISVAPVPITAAGGPSRGRER